MSDAKTKAAAFLAVTLQRACHNSFIEWAKGDNEHAKYTVSSVIFVAQVVCVLLGWVLAHSSGGSSELKKCFDVGNLSTFAHIGLIYALGDIFEMDLMQWFILFTTSSGMLEYVLVGKAKGGSMTFSPFGVGLALTKVAISCYVAVLNSAALQKDKNTFPVQFSCLKVSWAAASLVYMVVKDGLLGDGDMFGEWTHRTVVLVFCGFILKTLFNQYLLKIRTFQHQPRHFGSTSCICIDRCGKFSCSGENDPLCSEAACNIAKVCEVMTNSSLGDEVQRLVTLRDLQGIEDLPPRGQTQVQLLAGQFRGKLCETQKTWRNSKCRHSMPGILPQVGTELPDFWFYQTCKEFGFYQTCEDDCMFVRGLANASYMASGCMKLFNITIEDVQSNIDSTNFHYGGLLPLDDKEHLGRPKLDPAGAFDPSLTLKVRDVPQR
eukprot:g9863.t1